MTRTSLSRCVRLNEVLSAQWSWVDYTRGILSLPDSKTGAKPVYLSSAAVDLLKRQKAAIDARSIYIFPSIGGKTHFINLRKAWVQICERANLKDVRIHDLRHTSASIAVGGGASLAIVGKPLGHTQAQTTLRYAHVDTDPALIVANQIGAVVQKAFSSNDGKSKRNKALSKPKAASKAAKGMLSKAKPTLKRRAAAGEYVLIVDDRS